MKDKPEMEELVKVAKCMYADNLTDLCVDIELEAALLHGGEDGRPGLLADVGMVIQNSGNGAHSIARFRSQILDRHGYTSLFKS